MITVRKESYKWGTTAPKQRRKTGDIGVYDLLEKDDVSSTNYSWPNDLLMYINNRIYRFLNITTTFSFLENLKCENSNFHLQQYTVTDGV